MFDDILATYSKQVQLPWAADTPPAGRVWIVWYDKSLQQRFTGRLAEFEHATLKGTSKNSPSSGVVDLESG